MHQPFQPQALDQERHPDFETLRSERIETDAKIIQWANSLIGAVLAGQLQYTSSVNPATRSYEMWLAVSHVFNHQTHHRGQISLLLSQLGEDYGVTDLIWLPDAVGKHTN